MASRLTHHPARREGLEESIAAQILERVSIPIAGGVNHCPGLGPHAVFRFRRGDRGRKPNSIRTFYLISGEAKNGDDVREDRPADGSGRRVSSGARMASCGSKWTCASMRS